MKAKSFLSQFSRYVVVGGIAFVVDFLTLSVTYGIVLKDKPFGLIAGTAAGFIVGIIVNYFASKKFVFNSSESRVRASFVEFLIYALIDIAGLLLTEAGMYLGVELIELNYAVTKVFVAAFVLVWNFLARRFLVYK